LIIVFLEIPEIVISIIQDYRDYVDEGDIIRELPSDLPGGGGIETW
jgi:hypothetical protein